MVDPAQVLKTGDALLIIDVQNDFCPGGALPIEHGDRIIPECNRWIQAAKDHTLPIYLSRDWHPKNHLSFKPYGGQWPPHCVQDTEGAALHPDLFIPEQAVVVTKGVRFDQDQNSAFDQTGLGVHFRKQNIKRIWMAGLALDVCVRASALDARKDDFTVQLLLSGTRPVTAGGGLEAIAEMHGAGVDMVEDS